jgi:class 3 adenylate cyclase
MGGRRLTAILAADIAGYSALMGANDVETLADLKGHQSAVLPLIAGYNGRVIDTAGDGILAEFPSVFNAVKCAIAIQEVMSERNASIAPERRMQFRIGINQGDVLFDENRIYGDGINIAARLEGICEPGGVCISGKVYEEIKGRFEIQYDDIGDQTLKNISQPVRAYRITVSGAPAKETKHGVASRLPYWAVAATVLAVAVLGGAVALLVSRDWSPVRPQIAGSGMQERLSAALEASVPKMPLDIRQRAVAAFAKTKAHRAMAIAPAAQRVWWTAEWPNREVAEERVLEKCQQYFDELCALIATDDVLASPGVDGRLPVRDAPRVRYNGVFNPERIPAITRVVEQRMDVAGYLTASSPKASAFHAVGVLYVVVAAPTQRAAEEQALRGCNEDPARTRAGGGPCYLYSVDNRVVLPLRATGAHMNIRSISLVGPSMSVRPSLRNERLWRCPGERLTLT